MSTHFCCCFITYYHTKKYQWVCLHLHCFSYSQCRCSLNKWMFVSCSCITPLTPNAGAA